MGRRQEQSTIAKQTRARLQLFMDCSNGVRSPACAALAEQSIDDFMRQRRTLARYPHGAAPAGSQRTHTTPRSGRLGNPHQALTPLPGSNLLGDLPARSTPRGATHLIPIWNDQGEQLAEQSGGRISRYLSELLRNPDSQPNRGLALGGSGYVSVLGSSMPGGGIC